jgi:O-antigen biosynthesis protein
MLTLSSLFSKPKKFNLRENLIPINQLQTTRGGWKSTGDDPYFVIQKEIQAKTWFRMVLQLDMDVERQASKFYLDFGAGVDEQNSVVLEANSGKVCSRLIYAKNDITHFRFDPVSCKSKFQISTLELELVSNTVAICEVTAELSARSKLFAELQHEDILSKATDLSLESGTTLEEQLHEHYDRLFVEFSAPTSTYKDWIKYVEAPHFSALSNIDQSRYLYQPLISILVPIYKTDPAFLKEMIHSVQRQTYANWQLCLVDDASDSAQISKILDEFASRDDRIDVKHREGNGHISATSNDAISLARGDYCALLDHDDLLADHALLEIVRALNNLPNLKVLYSDEDKIDKDGLRTGPHFKSDWNLDLLYSHNYISHLGVYKTELLEAVGGFRLGYEGSQDYDLLLRCVEKCRTEEIYHIPWVLYHWRAIEGSTAFSSDQKEYTSQAGVNALQSHFERCGMDATVEPAKIPNVYKVNFNLPQRLPLVSLLIPTRDGLEILQQAVKSILGKTTYPNYEIIILDNQSCEKETLEYFTKISGHERVSVVNYDHAFNYSAINNYGAAKSKGSIIGLINNDIEVINPQWLTEMVCQCIRKDIGCVGAKLFYPNDTIQHAGVILGIGGVAGHSHKHFHHAANGYFSRLQITQNLSAVTAAALLVRREVFLEVAGLSEALPVAFNDVDFCLKVRRAGYRNLWTPFAKLYHHESVSRGDDTSGEKSLRFQKEVNWILQKWGPELSRDPFYSPHLSLTDEDFSLSTEKYISIDGPLY